MTNGHSIPVLSEVRVVKSWHPNVHEGTVGTVEGAYEDGYAVNVPTTTDYKPWKGNTHNTRTTLFFHADEIEIIPDMKHLTV